MASDGRIPPILLRLGFDRFVNVLIPACALAMIVFIWAVGIAEVAPRHFRDRSLPECTVGFLGLSYLLLAKLFNFFMVRYRGSSVRVAVAHGSHRAVIDPGSNAEGAAAGGSHCDKCDSWRPARAHHCSICRSCISLRDHHCIFTGWCVHGPDADVLY